MLAGGVRFIELKGADEGSGPAGDRPEDTAAVERQVNKQIDDKLDTAAQVHDQTVESMTTCTKQSDTAYKCLTTFTSPPNQAQVVTNVTCGRSGGGCITEAR